MSIKKNLSTGSALLLKNLTTAIDATLGGEKPPSDLEVSLDNKTLADVLDGYVTTTDVGERAVTVDDLQAVGNFRRDFQQVTRIYNGDAGVEHMEANVDATSFRTTVNLGNLGTSVQAAFFKPGKEDQGNTNFVSITDAWDGSDEDKAVEAHLKSLSQRLVAKK
jgi:hypothetical protein